MTYLNRIRTNTAMLDRPIWSALNTCLAPISERMGKARALPESVGPLAATASAEDFGDFMTLMSHRKEPLITLEVNTPVDPRLCLSEEHVPGVQMIGVRPERPRNTFKIEELSQSHAAQILDLAQRTRPGPFAARTHTLGDFLGVFEDGHLIAMAGQRLKLPGFTEISAVCVDPAFRGRGLAAELVRKMCEKIQDNGDVPILHAYESNVAATSLYERLGFNRRARLQATHWVENAAVHIGQAAP